MDENSKIASCLCRINTHCMIVARPKVKHGKIYERGEKQHELIHFFMRIKFIRILMLKVAEIYKYTRVMRGSSFIKT